MQKILKKPSAWLPIAMSAAALALILSYLLIVGNVHQEDEGAAAHLFQLLMAGQLPIIAYFAFSWLPKKPKQALWVLGLQFIAAIVPFLLLYFLEM